MKQMTDREKELTQALHDACSCLDRARTFIEDKSKGSEIMRYDKRLTYVLRSGPIREVLKKYRKNQIIITKIDDSTLTRVDIRYVVRLELLNDGLPGGMFSFMATDTNNLERAWLTVKEVSDTIEMYGIDYEVVDETYE